MPLFAHRSWLLGALIAVRRHPTARAADRGGPVASAPPATTTSRQAAKWQKEEPAPVQGQGALQHPQAARRGQGRHLRQGHRPRRPLRREGLLRDLPRHRVPRRRQRRRLLRELPRPGQRLPRPAPGEGLLRQGGERGAARPQEQAARHRQGLRGLPRHHGQAPGRGRASLGRGASTRAPASRSSCTGRPPTTSRRSAPRGRRPWARRPRAPRPRLRRRPPAAPRPLPGARRPR